MTSGTNGGPSAWRREAKDSSRGLYVALACVSLMLRLTSCAVDGGSPLPGASSRPASTTSAGGPAVGWAKGRLSARPEVALTASIRRGRHTVPIRGGPRPVIYVPPGLRLSEPVPLVVMAHGAGGGPKGSVDRIDEAVGDRALILAPAAADVTWDMISGRYGPDVQRLDSALSWVFQRANIDPEHIAMAGFSDGASWALSIGLINGDLFSYVIGFSPGVLGSGSAIGTPRVWISHGNRDVTLPPAVTSEPIVDDLRRSGYSVRYVRFPGTHELPANIAARGINWFLGAAGS